MAMFSNYVGAIPFPSLEGWPEGPGWVPQGRRVRGKNTPTPRYADPSLEGIIKRKEKPTWQCLAIM